MTTPSHTHQHTPIYTSAAVIFQNGAYAGDMASLAKLVCLSSAVHQICFMISSQMP